MRIVFVTLVLLFSCPSCFAKKKLHDYTAAVVRNGVVENVIILNDQNKWTPPKGAKAIDISDSKQVGIGWTFDGKKFHAPKDAK